MKERLDLLLVDKRLVESRTKAQWLIRNGFTYVDGKIIKKPGKLVDNDSKIELTEKFPYVGRGGLKLEAALKSFSVSPNGKICLDIGASVGGFTDCLLKYNATKVYVIDTATNLLHPSLICKLEKVIKYLGVDARTFKTLPELVDLITIDITFASLKSVLPNIIHLLKKEGEIIALIKPVFETEFHDLKRFDNIVDPDVLIDLLVNLIGWCSNNRIYLKDIMKSPLPGKGGSIEFFVYFKLYSYTEIDYKSKIKKIVG